jgi:hypothetical protein
MPIFEKRCFGCHTGDGVAAEEHDFSHVEALRAARTAIADEIATCSMPMPFALAEDLINAVRNDQLEGCRNHRDLRRERRLRIRSRKAERSKGGRRWPRESSAARPPETARRRLGAPNNNGRNAMHATSQALVHALLASVLQTASTSVRDSDVLDELGANEQVLVYVASKLEELQPENGDFPIVPLAYARTVGDLVELVESWSRRDRTVDPLKRHGSSKFGRARGIG